MKKLKNIFNALLLSFVAACFFTLGLQLQPTVTISDAATENYENVSNSLPDYLSVTDSSGNSLDQTELFLLATDDYVNVSIAADDYVELISGSDTYRNYAYKISDSEFYYFNFSTSISLYYNVTNAQLDSSSLTNLLSSYNLSNFVSNYDDSTYSSIYITSYGITPNALSINFKLDTSTSFSVSSDGTITLDNEGVYTLAIPYTSYYTADGGESFTTDSSSTIYFTFMAFKEETYIDANTGLPSNADFNSIVSSSTLVSNTSYSRYFYYNYASSTLPALTYDPSLYELTITYVDQEENETIITVEYSDDELYMVDENGQILENGNSTIFATIDQTGNAVLTFNNVGYYDLHYDFIYHKDSAVYNVPISSVLDQRLYVYGLQMTYTDYSDIDASTNTTTAKELKGFSSDYSSFTTPETSTSENATATADITNIATISQHASSISDASTIASTYLTEINSSSLSPVSTNQTPIKFTYPSNITISGSYYYRLSGSEGSYTLGDGQSWNGDNLNSAGTYLVVAIYTCSDYLSSTGTTLASYYHYQVFFITITNTAPTVNVYQSDGTTEIYSKGYTNSDVYIIDNSASSLYDAAVTITLSARNYSASTTSYYFQDVDITTIAYSGFVYAENLGTYNDALEGKTGLYISVSNNNYANAEFTIKITSVTTSTPSTRTFYIDNNEIGDITATTVTYATSKTYTIGDLVSANGTTNQPVIFGWNEKASGALTYGYYKYYSMEDIQYWATSTSDSSNNLVLTSIFSSVSGSSSKVVPTNATLDLSEVSTWTSYTNSYPQSSTISSSYVRSGAGLYVLHVYDDAGNSSYALYLIDNSSPTFVMIQQDISSGNYSYQVLGTSETLTVSEDYTVSIEWGEYKGIYISSYPTDSFAALSVDAQNNQSTELQKLLSSFFTDNSTSRSYTNITPGTGSNFTTYSGQYLCVSIDDEYFVREATGSGSYTRKSGYSYTITLISSGEAVEGTYKFLIRDSSNTQLTSDQDNAYLLYPSAYLTINVTSDASKLSVYVDDESDALTFSTYSLTGTLYETTNESGETVYVKNETTSSSASSNKYKYMYYTPTSATGEITLSYIPLAKNGSQIDSITLQFYPYEVVTEEVEYTSHANTSFTAYVYYYSLASSPSRTISIFTYDNTTSYTAEEEETYVITFATGSSATPGKYVITRTYTTSAADKYDYYERTITFIVDYNGVVSQQETITHTTTELDGSSSTDTSLESIVGGDIYVTMYSDSGSLANGLNATSEISVSFPKYSTETGLNEGSVYTSKSVSESSDPVAVLNTNKVPVAVNVPAYKYTTYATYDYATNSFIVTENNALSYYGDAEIVENEVADSDNTYSLVIEGVIIATYQTKTDAEEALETLQESTAIVEYQLSAKIKFTDASTNTTYWYRTNGTTTNGYLNFYAVSSENANVSSTATPVTFSKAGTYVVTIYQAGNEATTTSATSFKDLYKFSFEIESVAPDFDALTDTGAAINSVFSGSIENYYTNSSTIIIQWEDSSSEYMADIDRSAIVIRLYSGSSVLATLNSSTVESLIDTSTSGLIHTLTLDLTDLSDYGYNASIFSSGNFVSVTMQYEGHNADYYETVTKRINIDYTAPIETLVSLMDNTAAATSIFTRIYQEKNMRVLYDHNGDKIDTSDWTTASSDLMENVSYSFTIGSGSLKYYSYVVNVDFFDNAITSLLANASTPTSAQEIYFREIEDLSEYTQVTSDSFSVLAGYNALTGTDTSQLVTDMYYEIVETDLAGNLAVYIVYLHADNDDDIALSYSNLRNSGSLTNEQIATSSTTSIYSNTGFTLTTLSYNSDPWAVFTRVSNGVSTVYMRSPWLDSDSLIYQITISGSSLTFTEIDIGNLFSDATSSSTKHQLQIADRENGNIKIVYIAIMDASLTISKVSSQNQAIVSIDVPSATQALSTTTAYVYPVLINIYRWNTTSGAWEATILSGCENSSGDPSAWQSGSSYVTFSYTSGKLYITIAVENTSDKFKYEVIDNFGNTTTLVQLVNEESYSEIIAETDYYLTTEADSYGSTTYLTSGYMYYQYNNLIYNAVVAYSYVDGEVVEISDFTTGTRGSNISYYLFSMDSSGSCNKAYVIYLYEVEDTEKTTPIKVTNIHLYYSLATLSDSIGGSADNEDIWLLDKNNQILESDSTSETSTLTFTLSGIAYTAVPSIINTYSANVGVYFDNGQALASTTTPSYLRTYSYSVYISSDGATWTAINEYYGGYTISGTGTYYLLITYDDTDIFTGMCNIIEVNILDSTSVFYYVSMDGEIISASDYRYTNPNTGTEYSTVYLLSVAYSDKADRIVVGANEDLEVTLSFTTVTTSTSVRVEIYSYDCTSSSGSFVLIYLGETSSILSLLTYSDATGSSVSMLSSSSMTVVASEDESSFSKLRITFTSYYGIEENAINVSVYKLFGSSYELINTPIYSSTDGLTSYIYLSRTGTYRLSFYDSCAQANTQLFNGSSTYTVVFLSSVPFVVTYTEGNEEITTEPVNRSVYNGQVQISLVNQSSYFQTSGYPTISVLKDGVQYTDYTLSNYVYTFTEPGYYSVTFSATATNGVSVRQEAFVFTIISPTESRYAYEFSSYSTYYIKSVKKNNVDITQRLISNSGLSTVTIDGTTYLSQLIVSYFDEKTGAGTYEVCICTGDDIYTNTTANEFSFSFWINMATPPITVSVDEGSSTSSTITVSFNVQNLFDAVGDCYLVLPNATYNITADTISSYDENATFSITTSGTHYIQLYTTSGNLLYSYKVIKTTPLNTWAIIAIIIGVIAVIAIVVVTFLLRKRLKIK